MASVHRRGRKGIYTAKWRDATGRLWGRTTKTSDRKKAQQMADDWEREAQLPPDRLTVEHMQRVMGEIYRRFTGRSVTSKKLRPYAEAWLQITKAELAEGSQPAYEGALNSFLASMAAAGRDQVPLFEIERHDVIRWRDERRRKVSGSTVNKDLRIVRLMFHQAKADGLCVENPVEAVKPVKVHARERQSPSPYDKAKLSELLAVCDPEWQSMIVHGYYTSQRLKDIALMQLEQVDPIQRQVRFVTGKTGKTVIVEMPDAYLNWFLERPSQDNPKAYLHPECAAAVLRSKGMTVGTLSNRFAGLLWKAGLREQKVARRAKEEAMGRGGKRKRHKYTFHSLRHTLVSDLARSGVPRSLVQDMVGHESAAVNAIYTHFDAATKRQAAAKLPDVTPPDTSQLSFLDTLDKPKRKMK